MRYGRAVSGMLVFQPGGLFSISLSSYPQYDIGTKMNECAAHTPHHRTTHNCRQDLLHIHNLAEITVQATSDNTRYTYTDGLVQITVQLASHKSRYSYTDSLAEKDRTFVLLTLS